MGRVKTGIQGLDDLIEGGFCQNSTILVSGSAGAGKTIFASQFLYEGASKYEEPGVFVTLEEPEESIERNAKRFGWDFGALKAKKLLSIIKFTLFTAEHFNKFIAPTIGNIDAKRMVVDSISAFGMTFESEKRRFEVFRLLEMIRRLKCTVILTCEIPIDSMNRISRFGIEEFMTDGVIVLHNIRKGNIRVRALEVLKMRGTEHESKLVPFEITNKGFKIYPEGKVY